mmetsp:Transcript_30839/g.77420  ORF Transcript_30839/g.77420 Transcript_30839/m.77420 type:complete len:407 (-) Transcript_30839:829-2049(-)
MAAEDDNLCRSSKHRQIIIIIIVVGSVAEPSPTATGRATVASAAIASTAESTAVHVAGTRRLTLLLRLGLLTHISGTEALLTAATAATTTTAVATATVRRRTGHALQPAGHLLLGLGEQVEQLASHGRIERGDQRGGHTGGAGAAGTTDAVDVLVDVVGHVHVDDVLHAADVDTARGDIGGDEERGLAALEGAERILTLLLTAVAVDGGGREVLLGEIVLEVVGVAFGLHKDQREVVAHAEQQVDQDIALVVVSRRDADELLRDQVGGTAHAAHRQEQVVVEEARRQVLDLLGEGGAEHERLARTRVGHVGALHNVADLRLEAQIEHAIGLVQHQIANVGQRDAAALHQVHQTTGRGHQDVHGSIAQLAHLLAERRAAVHHHRAQPGAVAKLARLQVDLRGELARR